MSNTTNIEFPTVVQALGRSGTMKAVGLHVSLKGRRVTIAPINSKQQVGKCFIQIPAYAEDLENASAMFRNISKRVGREPKFREMEFTKPMRALGRSGEIDALGIHSFARADGVVRISPVNSRGDVAKCDIEMPATSGVLMSLSRALDAIYDKFYAQQKIAA